MSDVPRPLRSGDVVADAFRVERLLSTGGMGAVYVATQLKTQRRRALKLMHPELSRDARFRERFQQEAQVGAKIASEHVVEVVDAGFDDATGMPWLAMELLLGTDLGDLVESSGPLSSPQVRVVFEQLTHALAAAHRAQVVHRDLKPDNLFVASARRADVPFTVKVLDFGIAKVVAEAQTQATQTMGTPLWMAPEQTAPDGRISPATDVWALGLIAFYLLTSKPFWLSANTDAPSQVALIREIAIDPLPSASARASEIGVEDRLPPEFDGWFAQCVTREVTERFDDVETLMAELAVLLGDELADALALSKEDSSPSTAGDTAPLETAPSSGAGAATVEAGPATPMAATVAAEPVALDRTEIADEGSLEAAAKGSRTKPKKKRRRAKRGAAAAPPRPGHSRPGAAAPERQRRLILPAMLGVLVVVGLVAWMATRDGGDVAESQSADPAVLATTTPVSSGGAAGVPGFVLTRRSEPTAQPEPPVISRKEILLAKLKDDTATPAELRELRGLCKTEGDRLCVAQVDGKLSPTIRPVARPTAAPPSRPASSHVDPTGHELYKSLTYE